MKIYHLFIFLFLFSVYSCDSKDGEGWTSAEFDSTPHMFSKGVVDTIIVSKNNVGWWFTDLLIDNKAIYFNDNTIVIQKDTNGNVYKFEYEWISIEKLDNKRIRIILKENKTEKKRTLSFVVQAGNAFNTVSLVQKE